MDPYEIAQAVYNYAKEHYEEKYGWSEIVECFDIHDIEVEFVIARGSTPESKTVDEAIARAAWYVDIKQERYREAVGPDVKCQTCGAIFPENTTCPDGH